MIWQSKCHFGNSELYSTLLLHIGFSSHPFNTTDTRNNTNLSYSFYRECSASIHKFTEYRENKLLFLPFETVVTCITFAFIREKKPLLCSRTLLIVSSTLCSRSVVWCGSSTNVIYTFKYNSHETKNNCNLPTNTQQQTHTHTKIVFVNCVCVCVFIAASLRANSLRHHNNT